DDVQDGAQAAPKDRGGTPDEDQQDEPLRPGNLCHILSLTLAWRGRGLLAVSVFKICNTAIGFDAMVNVWNRTLRVAGGPLQSAIGAHLCAQSPSLRAQRTLFFSNDR